MLNEVLAGKLLTHFTPPHSSEPLAFQPTGLELPRSFTFVLARFDTSFIFEIG